jgi:branched-subunit amino acid ABC-type transport system permease component
MTHYVFVRSRTAVIGVIYALIAVGVTLIFRS